MPNEAQAVKSITPKPTEFALLHVCKNAHGNGKAEFSGNVFPPIWLERCVPEDVGKGGRSSSPCKVNAFLPPELFPPEEGEDSNSFKAKARARYQSTGSAPAVEEWWNWTPITKVALNGCGIRCLEDERMRKMLADSLKVLEARNNVITHIPSYLTLEDSRLVGDIDAIKSLAPTLTHLILADNRIAFVPTSFFQFLAGVPIQVLDFSNNRIPSIPDSIGELGEWHLTHLDLSGNQLDFVPQSLFSLRNLFTLKVARNNLTSLTGTTAKDSPSGALAKTYTIFDLVHLADLDVSQNQIETLFDIQSAGGFKKYSLPDLRILDARSNKMKNLVSQSVGVSFVFPLLKDINLAFNQLESLNYPSLTSSSFPALEVLDVQNNIMNVLPNFILPSYPELTDVGTMNLKKLDLRNNNLTILDPRLGLLTKLEGVFYTGNVLRGYPTSSLDKLIQYLRSRLPDAKSDVADSRPRAQPDNMVSVSQAKPNYVDDLRNFMEQPVKAVRLARQNSTDPQMIQVAAAAANSNNSGAKKPSDKLLDLSNKKLALLPNDFFQSFPLLPSHLIMSDNTFMEAPQCLVSSSTFLGGMISSVLVSLDLSGNKIREFGTSISPQIVFPVLEILRLNRNGMRKFDVLCYKSMPQLKELYLEQNLFTDYPENLHGLVTLQTLVLKNNQIEQMPMHVMETLVGLEVLDVSNNELIALPVRLGVFRNRLKTLSCSGNRFKKPQPAIVEQGTIAILNYLAERM